MFVNEPPRIEVANLPTPLVRLERLSRELDGAALWIKRDDLTGLELSGNKIRKLEYIVADVQAGGCDTLVTEGASQSNHCRATAALCAKLGLHCVLLLRPKPTEEPQGNHLLDTLFGAEVRSFGRAPFEAGRERIVLDVLADLRARGRRPRYTPAGASEPLGCWGYLRAAVELVGQVHAAGIADCDVVTAVSSGATYAGLLLGARLHGADRLHIHAVPVSDNVAFHEANVLSLCRLAIAQYRLPLEPGQVACSFLDGYVGEGYAIPYRKALDALHLLARTEGILLDPVYTAKAFCAVLDAVRSGNFGRERPVVFLHTGGVFSNFAWGDILLPHV